MVKTKTNAVQAKLRDDQMDWKQSQDSVNQSIKKAIDICIQLYGKNTDIKTINDIPLNEQQKQWLKNQSNVNNSISMLINMAIKNVGMNDVFAALLNTINTNDVQTNQQHQQIVNSKQKVEIVEEDETASQTQNAPQSKPRKEITHNTIYTSNSNEDDVFPTDDIGLNM